MPKQEKDFKFDQRAAAYDDGLEGKLSQRFYRLLRNTVDLIPNSLVLDVGCGTGALLCMLAASSPIQGFGIDMEENMIAQAKKRCPEMTIRVSNCDQTPFQDGFFDTMTACMAFHHFSNKTGFAKEAARIIKSGGKLYIADPNFPLVIRKVMNGVLRLFGVVGWFGTANEIAAFFAPYGFELTGSTKDKYAQVVMLRKRLT